MGKPNTQEYCEPNTNTQYNRSGLITSNVIYLDCGFLFFHHRPLPSIRAYAVREVPQQILFLIEIVEKEKVKKGFADQKDFNSHEGDTVQKTNQYFDRFTTGACDDD